MHAVTLWTKSKIELLQSLFSREEIIGWLSPLEKKKPFACRTLWMWWICWIWCLCCLERPLPSSVETWHSHWLLLLAHRSRDSQIFSFPRSWILRFLAHRIQNDQILAPSVLNAEFWLDPLLTLRFYNPRYFQFQGFFCSYNKFQSESMPTTRIEYKECVQSDDDMLSIQMHARACHW